MVLVAPEPAPTVHEHVEPIAEDSQSESGDSASAAVSEDAVPEVHEVGRLQVPPRGTGTLGFCGPAHRVPHAFTGDEIMFDSQ